MPDDVTKQRALVVPSGKQQSLHDSRPQMPIDERYFLLVKMMQQ
jgi:hypothetical protein